MTSGVSIVGSAQAAVAPSASVAPASAGSSNFAAAVANSASSSSSVASVLVHSPRVIDDPAVGLITEYISANGSEVIAQIPSAVTVAYLRLGLTAQGFSKSAAEQTSITA